MEPLEEDKITFSRMHLSDYTVSPPNIPYDILEDPNLDTCWDDGEVMESLEGKINDLQKENHELREIIKGLARKLKPSEDLAKEIILALDDYGRGVNPDEYGLPIAPTSKSFDDPHAIEMFNIVKGILFYKNI